MQGDVGWYWEGGSGRRRKKKEGPCISFTLPKLYLIHARHQVSFAFLQSGFCFIITYNCKEMGEGGGGIKGDYVKEWEDKEEEDQVP